MFKHGQDVVRVEAEIFVSRGSVSCFAVLRKKVQQRPFLLALALFVWLTGTPVHVGYRDYEAKPPTSRLAYLGSQENRNHGVSHSPIST